VREESHLDDMRSAIRGDFERLAERRGEQDLMRVSAERAHVSAVDDESVSDTVSAVSRIRPEDERRSFWRTPFRQR
jgi:hypothetical protein